MNTFSFEIRLSLWHFSVFAVLLCLCVPEGRSCFMLDHFELAYLEKSMPDTFASPQLNIPLYIHVSYKGIVEMPAVFSESTMVCQDYPSPSWRTSTLVHHRSTLNPSHGSDIVQCDVRNMIKQLLPK